MKDFVRRGRSNSGSGPAPSIRSVKATRMSILPSVKFPSLRRQDPNDPPPNNKQALLTLSFSSRSFLDSSVQDATTQEVFYIFKTVGTSTTVSRTDKKQVFHKTISIKWPRSLPMKTGKDYTDGVLIQMKNARWYGGETLLKPGSHPNASRKFSIPNYSQAMKWKRYGQTYWCTTTSVKGPVATLDTTKGPEPFTLTIYETLHDKYDPDALSGFRGVSILLIDYLLLTAMLLVTDLQEWMLVRKSGEGGSMEMPIMTDANGQGPSLAPDVPFRSDPKFRKILYGEPIYPKVTNEERSRLSAERARSPSPVGTPPRSPATPESGMPTFVYPESESSSPGPSSRNETLLPAMTDSEDEDDEDDDYDTFSLPDPHRASALAESFHFSSIARTHSSSETNYYNDRPPVPPLPIQYAKSLMGRNFSSQPSTPISGSFVPSCEPPLPPLHHLAELISRPRSSPPFQPLDRTNSTDNSSSIMHSSSSNHIDNAHSRNYPEALEHPRIPSIARAESIRSYTSTTSRSAGSPSGSGSTAKRPLPRPPMPPVITVAPPVARRVQSSSQLANYPSFPVETPPSPQQYHQQQQSSPPPPQRPQRSLPPTPGLDASLTSNPSSPLPSSSSSSAHPATDSNYDYDHPSHSNTYLRVTTSRTLMPPGSDAAIMHSRQPPITKASQEDLASYVHLLTSPQRDLPPEPLPSTSIFDVPPPAYNTIIFGPGSSTRQQEQEQQTLRQQTQYGGGRRPTLPDLYDSAVTNSP